MDRMPQPERERAPNFKGFKEVLEQFVRNALPVNKVQALAGHMKISSRSDTWISSTRTEQDATRVSIGELPVPKDVLRKFRWGAETKEQQYVVKFAHEHAHVVQEEFDIQLLRWLDGASDIPEEYVPYIHLYAELTTIGGLHGLSQMDLYHEQNRTTGHLSVPTHEDMAETIGSYLLGTEYFLYRLQNARVQITQEQAKKLIDYVVAVVTVWEQRRGGGRSSSTVLDGLRKLTNPPPNLVPIPSCECNKFRKPALHSVVFR